MTTQTKKKVLFLITKSNWGGAQRYVYDLATNIPSDQYDVAVAAGGSGPLIEKLQAAGITVHSIPALQRDISAIKEVAALWQIAKLIKVHKPDILHINSSKAGVLGSLIGRLLRVPRILFTAHGWAFNENRNLAARHILYTLHWLTVLFAHKTITVSYALKEQFNSKLLAGKLAVIHNGRAAATLQSRERSRLVLSTYAPVLEGHLGDFWSVTIAELHPIKQHTVMIDAMREISTKVPYARHLIIGDGQDRELLERHIKAADLEAYVFLLGAIDEAAQFLKAADVFVLPSRSEALGYVAIESCQAGVPIIASRVGGLPEVITHDREGLLVPSGDSEALADAYITIALDQELRQRLAAAARVRGEDFGISKMVGKTIEVYENDPTMPRFEAEAAL